jgi:hypothetical protein
MQRTIVKLSDELQHEYDARVLGLVAGWFGGYSNGQVSGRFRASASL